MPLQSLTEQFDERIRSFRLQLRKLCSVHARSGGGKVFLALLLLHTLPMRGQGGQTDRGGNHKGNKRSCGTVALLQKAFALFGVSEWTSLSGISPW